MKINRINVLTMLIDLAQSLDMQTTQSPKAGKRTQPRLIQPWGTTDTWEEHLAKLKKQALIETCNEMIKQSAEPK